MNGMLNGSEKRSRNGQSKSTVSQVLILGYYDGPTDGIVKTGSMGSEFNFRLIEDNSDIRHFELRELPSGTINQIVEILAPYHTPQWPVWMPIWNFPSECIRNEIDERIDQLLEKAVPIQTILEIHDFLKTNEYHFQKLDSVSISKF